MTASEPTVGVLGATGQQGGAVVDALLGSGRTVRAIVRNPRSERSTALAERGVEVVTGDQDDPDSLAGPLSGLDVLYLMSTFAGDAGGPEREVARASGVIDAAVGAAVPRVVYSSVGGAERSSGIPHFESKYRIEQYLTARLPTVVVRPAYFMENLIGQLADTEDDEFVLRMPMPGDVPLQMVAVRDIGRVVAAALLDPAALGGDALEIAGDELTGDRAAQRIGAHLGRPGRYEEVPLTALGDDDLEAMFRWFVDTPGYQADIAATRRIDPDLLDLSNWLRAQR